MEKRERTRATRTMLNIHSRIGADWLPNPIVRVYRCLSRNQMETKLYTNTNNNCNCIPIELIRSTKTFSDSAQLDYKINWA